MPIRTQSDLPAKEILEKENIFVMDENRAMHQDIRPISIAILNLMPLKEDAELQLLRSLSNTPLQVDITFLTVTSHESKHTSISHLNKFYQTFDEIKDQRFDGGSGLLERTLYHYGLEQDKCDFYIAFVLGCAGRALLSLRDPKVSVAGKDIWYI